MSDDPAEDCLRFKRWWNQERKLREDYQNKVVALEHEVEALEREVARLGATDRNMRAERERLVQNPRVNNAIQTALESGELIIDPSGYLVPLTDTGEDHAG